MRENIANPPQMETLSFGGFQSPFNDISSEQKSPLISVSSNVYYGYQPLPVQNNTEPMHTEDLNKSFTEMDTTQSETRPINRKRRRDNTESSLETWKKRRQNEQLRPAHRSPRCSPTKMRLEEDLLRETHGCSYYHWVASNL